MDYHEEVCPLTAYFDNSATTKPCEKAVEKMLFTLRECWGNPSSSHQKGVEAQLLLNSCRKTLADKLSCSPQEIFFTSGGTESNNIAVLGAARAAARSGKRVITSAVEHPSVMRAFDRLESEGFEVIRIGTDRFGRIDLAAMEDALDDSTTLVSVMAVNNELGTVEPTAEIAALIRKKAPRALFHVDAVQAFGKIPLSVRRPAVDLMSVSSHKIHGPKGVGALYVKKGTKLQALSFGGGQENNLRPGTEAMPAIAGFAAAVEELTTEKSLKKVAALRDELVENLSQIPGLVINSPAEALPYIVNISLPGYPSETVLNFLSDRDICVSSGSACSKGHRSHVLTAAGLPAEIIDSSLRISFSRYTTPPELEYLIEGLKRAAERIMKR